MPRPSVPPKKPPQRTEQYGGHKRAQSAEARYYQYLEKHDDKNIIYDDEVEKLKRKGSLSHLSFEGELSDEENAFLISDSEDKKKDRNTSLLKIKIIISAFCVLVALLLNFAKFTISNTPSLIQMEFSAIPELIAGLTVHPLIGCAIVLIKNLLYYFINTNSFPSIPNKIILDILFILITCYLGRLFMKTKRNKRNQEEREAQMLPYRSYSFNSVFLSGLMGSLAAGAASVLTFIYITLPLFNRFFGQYGYTTGNIFKSYQMAFGRLQEIFPFICGILPSLNNITQGALIYNFPLTVIKYLICTIVAYIAYNALNNSINNEGVKK